MKLFTVSIAALAFFLPSIEAQAFPDLSKLTSCSLPKVFESVSAVGCSSPLDTQCMCTDKFLNDAAGRIMNGCPPKDAVGALQTMQAMCPNMELPDLSPLPDCTLGCVIETLKRQRCAGPTDKPCLCKPSFAISASACLLGKCRLQGTGNALNLLFGICRPVNKPGCSATGLWRLLDLKCIIPGFGKRDGRQGTPAAMQYRRLLEDSLEDVE